MKKKCTEVTEKVGEAEKAGMDWTDSHLKQLEHEVFQLRRREHQIKQLTLTEDPIQFYQVMTCGEISEVCAIFNELFVVSNSVLLSLVTHCMCLPCAGFKGPG